MQKTEVDEQLKKYRRSKGRSSHLRAEIKRIRYLISEAESAAIAPRGVDLSGMPHGTDVSDPTARQCVKLIEGTITREVELLREELSKAERELAQLELNIQYVDGWMDALSERERFVIELHVLEGAFWRDLVKRYEVAYGEEYSRDGLKRVQARAYQKIYEVADAVS